MVHVYSNNHYLTSLLCPHVGTVGRTAGGKGGERQGCGRREIPQTDHHSIGTGQAGLEGEKGDGKEGGGEREERGEERRKGGKDKLGATFFLLLPPLSLVCTGLGSQGTGDRGGN